MKRLHLNISLTSDLYERIKDTAAVKNMSMSSFIGSVLSGSIKCSAPALMPEDVVNTHCTVRLHGKAAAVLKEKSTRLGISPTVFIKDAVLNQKTVIINVDDGAADQLLDMVASCDSEIMAFIGSLGEIRLSQDTKQVIREIITDLLYLKEAFETYYHELLRTKKELENNLIERIQDGG